MADRDLDREWDELSRSREADDLSAAVAEDFRGPAGRVGGSDWDDDEDERDAASEAALAAGTAADNELPSSGLLSFYDRLRERIVRAVERRGGRLGGGAVKALLLVPDVFILLVRLLLDSEVPGSARALVGGALAYFILPVDLLPEAFVGAGGYLDDLVVATAVLAHTFSGELEPFARRHWSGPDELRVVLGDIAGAARGLVGADLYGRLERVLARRGVELAAEPEAAAEAAEGDDELTN